MEVYTVVYLTRIKIFKELMYKLHGYYKNRKKETVPYCKEKYFNMKFHQS